MIGSSVNNVHQIFHQMTRWKMEPLLIWHNMYYYINNVDTFDNSAVCIAEHFNQPQSQIDIAHGPKTFLWTTFPNASLKNGREMDIHNTVCCYKTKIQRNHFSCLALLSLLSPIKCNLKTAQLAIHDYWLNVLLIMISHLHKVPMEGYQIHSI